MNPKATILIVDDEPDLREVLQEYFVAQGYTALSAESAAAAGQNPAASASRNNPAPCKVISPANAVPSIAPSQARAYPALAAGLIASRPGE